MFILFGNRVLVADNHHMFESTSPYVYYYTTELHDFFKHLFLGKLVCISSSKLTHPRAYTQHVR